VARKTVVVEEPVWVVVRATVHRPRLARDHMATVDITRPEIQHELAAGWIVPIPADEQPTITTDPDTGGPILGGRTMRGKLGKAPATVDERDITFKSVRVLLNLPKPPANFGHGSIFADGEGAKDWEMNGNGPDDTVEPGFQGAGDCVFACGAHTTRETNKLAGKTVTITGKESISDYSAVTGYVIGDDSTDNGTNMRDALKYRQKTGLLDAHGNRHKIGAYVALGKIENLTEFYQACYVFSAVELGFNFQQAQDDQFNNGVWDYVPHSPIVGGHAIPAFGRNKSRAGAVSWAKHIWLTEAFLTNLVDECYAIVFPEELKNGKTERGMDLTQLNAALANL